MKSISTTLLLAAALATGAAMAHTELAASVPANGAMIAAAPENVELTFSAPVRLTALAIQKDGEQKRSLGPLPSRSATDFSVVLPATVAEGHFVVSWRALSEDSHVMTGEFMFAVGEEGTHGAHMNHQNMPAEQNHAEHGGAH